MDINNLSEHEKQMIAVAEGGDPNDPAENKDEVVILPSEDAKEGDKDETKADATEGDKEVTESEDKGDEEKAEGDNEDGESEDEELTDEQKELRKLKQEARDRKILDAVGGEEQYKELAKWAGTELSEEQRGVYNQAINSDNAEVAVFAAQALSAMKQVADINKHGYQGDVNTPNGDAGSNAPQGYESLAQMQADMSDARYRTDEAYRNKVMAKVAITPEGIL